MKPRLRASARSAIAERSAPGGDGALGSPPSLALSASDGHLGRSARLGVKGQTSKRKAPSAPRAAIELHLPAINAELAAGKTVTVAWLRYCALATAAGETPYAYRRFSDKLKSALRPAGRLGAARRANVANERKGVVSIREPGAWISVREGALIIKSSGVERRVAAGTRELIHLYLDCDAAISTRAVAWIAREGAYLYLLGEQFVGIATPRDRSGRQALTSRRLKNRLAQMRCFLRPNSSLAIAKKIVAEKAVLHGADAKVIAAARAAADMQSLLAVEGGLSVTWWVRWKATPIAFDYSAPAEWTAYRSRIVRVRTRDSSKFTAQAARDPANACINYVFAIVTSHILRALTERGFDPAFGFLHVARGGNAALVYDVQELVRAEAIEKTFELLTTRTFGRGDFAASDGAKGEAVSRSPRLPAIERPRSEGIKIGTALRKDLIEIARSIAVNSAVDFIEKALLSLPC
jgi:CRISP-associated protein Cas1